MNDIKYVRQTYDYLFVSDRVFNVYQNADLFQVLVDIPENNEVKFILFSNDKKIEQTFEYSNNIDDKLEYIICGTKPVLVFNNNTIFFKLDDNGYVLDKQYQTGRAKINGYTTNDISFMYNGILFKNGLSIAKVMLDNSLNDDGFITVSYNPNIPFLYINYHNKDGYIINSELFCIIKTKLICLGKVFVPEYCTNIAIYDNYNIYFFKDKISDNECKLPNKNIDGLVLIDVEDMLMTQNEFFCLNELHMKIENMKFFLKYCGEEWLVCADIKTIEDMVVLTSNEIPYKRYIIDEECIRVGFEMINTEIISKSKN